MSLGSDLRKSGPIGKGSTSPSSDEKLLSPTARETPAHNSGDNTQTKHTTSGKGFGELGGKGMGGAD